MLFLMSSTISWKTGLLCWRTAVILTEIRTLFVCFRFVCRAARAGLCRRANSGRLILDNKNPVPFRYDLDTTADVSAIDSIDLVEISGRVKWFDVAKGYGFIVPDNGAPDVLLH